MEEDNVKDSSIAVLLKLECVGTSLALQWLGLSAFHCRGPGSIPGRETNILRVSN